AGCRREVGPLRARVRTGHRLLGARRPDHPASALRSPGRRRSQGRRRGDGSRRGLPHGHGARDAADRRNGNGPRPPPHGIDRFGNPGNHSVPIHQAFGGFARGHGSEGLITMLDIIKAMLPSICVSLLFWYVIRNIFRADGNEREQVDKYYSEIDVSEVENNSESDVKMTSTKSSDYEKSEHGKGNAPRSHR